jgi:3-dehydroquinate dehydratase
MLCVGGVVFIGLYSLLEFSETFGWSALQTKFSLYHEKWQVDVFKVVIQAESMEDGTFIQSTLLFSSIHWLTKVFQLRQLATLCQQSVPVTLVAGGEKGTLSRVLNTFMNPVTHPLLPVCHVPVHRTGDRLTSGVLFVSSFPPFRVS